MAELCKQFEVHPTQITEWRHQFPKQAADAFVGGSLKVDPDSLVPLHAKIGNCHFGNQVGRTTPSKVQ